MSIFQHRVAEFLVATDVDRIPTNVSRQVLLYGKLGRWFPRDRALNWKLLSIKIMKQSRAIRDQGTILNPLVTTVVSAKLDFWVTFSVLVALRHYI